MSALPRNDTAQINALLRDIRSLELLMMAGQGSENPDVQKRTMQCAADRDLFIQSLYQRFAIIWPEY